MFLSSCNVNVFCVHVSVSGFLHLAEIRYLSVLHASCAFNNASGLAIAPHCNCLKEKCMDARGYIHALFLSDNSCLHPSMQGIVWGKPEGVLVDMNTFKSIC